MIIASLAVGYSSFCLMKVTYTSLFKKISFIQSLTHDDYKLFKRISFGEPSKYKSFIEIIVYISAVISIYAIGYLIYFWTSNLLK